MDNEELLQEEEPYIISLTDENGEQADFEYMDCIEYNQAEYLVLLPVEEENSLVILQIQPVDEEYENYLAVEDEQVLDAVYQSFKQRHPELNFAD